MSIQKFSLLETHTAQSKKSPLIGALPHLYVPRYILKDFKNNQVTYLYQPLLIRSIPHLCNMPYRRFSHIFADS